MSEYEPVIDESGRNPTQRRLDEEPDLDLPVAPSEEEGLDVGDGDVEDADEPAA